MTNKDEVMEYLQGQIDELDTNANAGDNTNIGATYRTYARILSEAKDIIDEIG